MKYIYTGTEQQLIDCGYKVFGDYHATKETDFKVEDELDDVFINLQEKRFYGVKIIKWNSLFNKADIKPYIQDLIDLGLVEDITNDDYEFVKLGIKSIDKK